VEIVPFPTVREADGLAMSSRNMRLNTEERMLAPEIYKTLVQAKELAGMVSVGELRFLSSARLEHKGFKVDYFEIADSSTLQTLTSWEQPREVIACVAAFLGKVRLIDNMILFSNFAG
jgi:pantoate--beta-alanine ligase